MRCGRILMQWTQGVILALCMAGPASPQGHIEDIIDAIRQRITDPNAGWSIEWQREYITAVEDVVRRHTDVPDYDTRLDIVRRGFHPYWILISQTQCNRIQFEVYKAEIDWFIDTLMSDPLPSEADGRALRMQLWELCSWSGEHLRGQFPFLEEMIVQEAQSVIMRELDERLASPLLPTFRRPLSSDQLRHIRKQWARSHQRWFFIWRHAQRNTLDQMGKSGASNPKTIRTQWFVCRCLRDLPGMLWFTVGEPPVDVLHAYERLHQHNALEVRAQAETRQWELALNANVIPHLEQVEQWSFVFSALLQTRAHPHRACASVRPAASTDSLLLPEP